MSSKASRKALTAISPGLVRVDVNTLGLDSNQPDNHHESYKHQLLHSTTFLPSQKESLSVFKAPRLILHSRCPIMVPRRCLPPPSRPPSTPTLNSSKNHAFRNSGGRYDRNLSSQSVVPQHATPYTWPRNPSERATITRRIACSEPEYTLKDLHSWRW